VRLVLPDPDAGDFEITSATDTSNGRFTFIAVPAGQYLLRASQSPRMGAPPPPPPGPTGTPAGRGGRGTGLPPPLPTEPMYWASMPVSVGAEDTGNVTLEMRPGAVMSGRVDFDGTVTPPERDQLARVLVTIVPEAQTLGVMMRGVVDAEGVFRT
jgi:hypothetical protein